MGMNVALTYETYYKQLNPSDKTKLLAEIDVGRDETKKIRECYCDRQL